ncbi:MAG: RNA polymerase sigma factor [Oscillospiraceae bacterium]|jgi:RNA polymerase sigma-70 factor (ECF subfamily)
MELNQDITERTLPRLIEEEPEHGMTLVIQRYGKPIRTICRNILADCGKADVEDTVLDCFINIWQAAGRFDPERGTSFRSYCYGIARTTALAKRREWKLAPLLSLEEFFSETSGGDGGQAQREEEQIVHEAVHRMEEPDRSIFLLRYFYYFRVKEIAARLGISPKQVENILARRKKDLRALLLEGGIECAENG